MTLLDGIKKILKMCGHALTVTVHDRLETMEQRQAETDNVVLRASIRLAEQVRRSVPYEVLPVEDAKNFRPALALARHLYAMFPTHGARVTGCDPADSVWSAGLTSMGYRLVPADGASEGVAIARVCGSLEWEEIGQGSSRPIVVVADLEAAAEDRVQAMRGLDYRWYLVLEHPRRGEAGRFYAHYPTIPPDWRGETIFFRDHATFLYALRWCQSVLRPVYFGPGEESD